MIGDDLLWQIGTSNISLELLGFVLVAAMIGGFTPLIQYVPVVGCCKPEMKVLFVLTFALICFLCGVRSADNRRAVEELRATLAVRNADLEIANKSLADAKERAATIEKQANEQSKSDSEYIASLQAIPVPPGCEFDPGGVRLDGSAGHGRPKSAGGSR